MQGQGDRAVDRTMSLPSGSGQDRGHTNEYTCCHRCMYSEEVYNRVRDQGVMQGLSREESFEQRPK